MEPIDRRALVDRHRIQLTEPKPWFQLGNGEFTFNADGTGLQTFAGNTMAHWAWHSLPLPPGCEAQDVPATGTIMTGRPTGGQVVPAGSEALYAWMYENPHRANLGRLRLVRGDGSALEPDSIAGLRRTLDLWSGLATSRYAVEGAEMRVETCCHPERDQVALRLDSRALHDSRLAVMLDFGYPVADGGEPWLGDWHQADRHLTERIGGNATRVHLRRSIDATVQHVVLCVTGGRISQASAAHAWMVHADPGAGPLEVVCWFGQDAPRPDQPDVAATQAESARHWEGFWRAGAAIDLSGSRDPRWRELERRIVLSQYVMAVQSAGSMPPQESGLHHNSWNGQSHLEMLWWHVAHFALWGRWEMARKSLDYLPRIAPMAAALAQQLGGTGLKWPKMVGPEGRNAPAFMHEILLWHQPHPIFLAELEYRLSPGRATLDRWKDVVFGTAEHMADYARWDAASDRYVLDPAIPCCEQGLGSNPTFELAYWRYGLGMAQTWRERLGMPRHPAWDTVRNRLAPLPVQDGVYLICGDWGDTYTARNSSHPDPIGAFAFLPFDDTIDPATAHRTVLEVLRTWSWKSCWGWDFPWMAMAAARVGEPGKAIDILLHDAAFNQYTADGINAGWYLPGNGALLYAVAMMADGWDGGPAGPQPGFPADGSWTVRSEGLQPAQ